VDNARYTRGTTNLALTRTEGGVDYTASLYYTLPDKRALPCSRRRGGGHGRGLPVGLAQDARGLALRRAGKLALVADNGYQGPALDGP
jgi:hypothetical protein